MLEWSKPNCYDYKHCCRDRQARAFRVFSELRKMMVQYSNIIQLRVSMDIQTVHYINAYLRVGVYESTVERVGIIKDAR